MTITWKQTDQYQWLSSDGRRVQFSPASQSFLVFNQGGYLGKDTTLGVAQQRTDASPTRLQDVEGAIPAFLLLSPDERATARRGQTMKKALTIETAIKDYNKLAADAAAKGLNYKPVTSFETLELAQASMEQVASSLRAHASAAKAIVNQKRTEPKKGVAKSEAAGTSSPTEEGETGTGPETGVPQKERSTMTTKTSKKASKKTAKKAPAAKKAATKVAAKGGTRNNVADDAKCSVVGANPFREGTSRHSQLELVRKGTVAAFLKAGGDRAYLSWYVRNGHAKAG